MRKECKVLFLICCFTLLGHASSLLLLPISPWEKAGGLQASYLATQIIRQTLQGSGWFQVVLFNPYSEAIASALDAGTLKREEVDVPERSAPKLGKIMGVDVVLWGKVENIKNDEKLPLTTVSLTINLLEVKTGEKVSYSIVGKGEGEANTSADVLLERAVTVASNTLLEKMLEREAREVPQARKEEALSLLEKGKQLLAQGKGEEAIAQLENASLIDPRNPDIYIALGDAYLSVKDYRRAEIQFRRARSLSAGKEEAYIGLAKVYKERKLGGLALSQIYTLLKINPQSKEGKIFLADLLREQGQYEEAGRILQELARETPDDPRVLWQLGEIYLNRKMRESALAYFKASLSDEPSQEKAMRVASLALEMGRRKDVLSALEKWLQLSQGKMTSGEYGKFMRFVDGVTDALVNDYSNLKNALLAGKMSRENVADRLDALSGEVKNWKALLDKVNPPSDFKRSFSHRSFAIASFQGAIASLRLYVEGMGDDKLQLADILLDTMKRDLALARFLEGK